MFSGLKLELVYIDAFFLERRARRVLVREYLRLFSRKSCPNTVKATEGRCNFVVKITHIYLNHRNTNGNPCLTKVFYSNLAPSTTCLENRRTEREKRGRLDPPTRELLAGGSRCGRRVCDERPEVCGWPKVKNATFPCLFGRDTFGPIQNSSKTWGRGNHSDPVLGPWPESTLTVG